MPRQAKIGRRSHMAVTHHLLVRSTRSPVGDLIEPFALRARDRPVASQLEIADCVPGRRRMRQAPSRQKRRSLSLQRHEEVIDRSGCENVFASADQEKARSHLGNPKIAGTNNGARCHVLLAQPRAQRRCEVLDHARLANTEVGLKTAYILNQDQPWSQNLYELQIVVKKLVPGIVGPSLARLRKSLARRSAREQVTLSESSARASARSSSKSCISHARRSIESGQ